MHALAHDADAGTGRPDRRFQFEEPPILQCNSQWKGIAGLQQRGRRRLLDNEAQLILLIGTGERLGFKVQVAGVEFHHLVKTRALQHPERIAGVNCKTVYPGSFRVGVKADLIRVAQTELFHHHRQRSGWRFLQPNSHFKFISFCNLPLRRQMSSLFIAQDYFAHARCIGGLQVENIFPPHDQGARIFGRNNPQCRT